MKKYAIVLEDKDMLCCSIDYVQKLLDKGVTVKEAERIFTIAHENATKAFYKDETDTCAILNMNAASQRLSALETIKTINSFIQEN